MYYARADAYKHIHSYMLHWSQSTRSLLFTPSSLLFSCSLGTRRWKTWRPHTPHGPTFQCWAAPHSWSLWLRISWSLAPRLDSRLQTPAGGWSLRTHNCSFDSDGKKVRGASLIRAWNLIYLRWWQQQQQQNHPSFINYSEKLQTAEALDSHCLIFPCGFLSGVQCMTVSSLYVCVCAVDPLLCPCSEPAHQCKLSSVLRGWRSPPWVGWCRWFWAWPASLLWACSSSTPLWTSWAPSPAGSTSPPSPSAPGWLHRERVSGHLEIFTCFPP